MEVTAMILQPILLIVSGLGLYGAVYLAMSQSLADRAQRAAKADAQTVSTDSRPIFAAAPSRSTQLLGAAAGAGLGLVITGIPGVATAAALFSWTLPVLIWEHRRERIAQQIDAALRRASLALQNGLEAGMNVLAALEHASGTVEAPLRDALLSVSVAVRAGQPIDVALDTMARRIPVRSVRRFADAVAVGLRFGADLNRVFASLQQEIENDARLNGLMQQHTAGVRTQARVMMGMVPVVLMLVVATFPPEQKEFYQGTTGTLVLILVAVGLYAADRIVRLVLQELEG